MATVDERRALLAVSCRWCSAKPGEECHAVTTGRQAANVRRRHDVRKPITTLDGGAHDLRWHDALGRPAPVLAAAVEARHETPDVGRPW